MGLPIHTCGCLSLKNGSHGSSYVKLHHAGLNFMPFLDIFPRDDERSLHLLHCLSSVPFIDSAMVGCYYKNRFIQYSGFFHRIHYFADVSVYFFEFVIIGWCIMTFLMSHMIRIIPGNVLKSAFSLFNVLHGFFA